MSLFIVLDCFGFGSSVKLRIQLGRDRRVDSLSPGLELAEQLFGLGWLSLRQVFGFANVVAKVVELQSVVFEVLMQLPIANLVVKFG